MSDILHILVEGDQDESFVQRVIKPWLVSQEKYLDVIVFPFACRKKETIENYVKTVLEQNQEIICLTDSTHAHCISGRMDNLINNEIGVFEKSQIFVVIKEIDSWYIAGVDKRTCNRIGIEYVERTERISKEDLHALIARSKYKQRLACRIEMLKNFNVILASERNRSFNRFYTKKLV
jgi:hypothetical protein